MPSTIKAPPHSEAAAPGAATPLCSNRDDHLIAWLAALALAIHVAEAALPSPLPGVKPGLANVITVAVLCRYGWRTAAWVSALRVLAGGLVLGTFLSPTFMLSAAGAATSLAVLWLAQHAPGRGFGAVGYSVVAALAHMTGQFYVAYWLFVPHPALHALFPILMTAAFVLGIANGIIAAVMLQRLPRT